MDERPKRRKDKYNPYTLMTYEDTYKVLFTDSLGRFHIIEVTPEIFNVFDEFELKDLSQMNEYDRHIEHLDFDDITYQRIDAKPISLEDEVMNNIIHDCLKNEISKLPEVQKRRLVLYFFNEMTLQEIAIIENCSPRAVKDSIDISIKKLRNLLEN